MPKHINARTHTHTHTQTYITVKSTNIAVYIVRTYTEQPVLLTSFSFRTGTSEVSNFIVTCTAIQARPVNAVVDVHRTPISCPTVHTDTHITSDVVDTGATILADVRCQRTLINILRTIFT